MVIAMVTILLKDTASFIAKAVKEIVVPCTLLFELIILRPLFSEL